MSEQPKVYTEPVAVLGEGPLWDVARARLTWVDCDQKKLFSLDPASGKAETTELPHNPGSYAWRAGGGMIMAYRNQLVLLDESLKTERTVETGADFSVERFNDGACDRKGRFWVGTMDRRLKEPVGHLFRIDPDLSVTRVAEGLVCSNGIAFSPDDRTMYHTDTGAARIWAYDFDLDSGAVGNRRVFADFAGGPGRPDGCTIDVDGHLWVAEIGAGRIAHLDPGGTRVGSIELPTRRPTSAMFGGDDLRTLFVTSMRHGLSPEDLAEQPGAGCLFAIRQQRPGLAEPRFAG